MLKFRFNLQCLLSRKRFYSLQTSAEGEKSAKSFQHTVFLTETKFPLRLKPNEIVERDARVQKEAQFLDYYAWQRENIKSKEFVLHDGPPYANGKPHIGHAINKILKDIILRSQLVQGNRVHYVPGWDCHGLPIEMVAIKSIKNPLTPVEIRKKSKQVACSMSKTQMEAFKQWGVIGDWNNQCYYTFDVNYIVNQLQIFWKFYEKGLIYYDLKPVFWSPSSETALAEAELLYKDRTSQAVTIRFETVQDFSTDKPVYLLVWTTTPWTLPFNKAVYYSPTLNYSLVKISTLPGLYIIASDLIQNLQEKLQKEIAVQSSISSENLKKLKYKHPWMQDEIMCVYESPNIQLSGTGLLHSVPGHGHEDFHMSLANKLKVECFVDEKGRYTSDMGDELAGLDVLRKGSDVVRERLSSEILVTENYQHSYPYDWRTNKPVIIRASKQWFIDTDQLKEKAIECMKEAEVPLKYFQSKLKSRSYWCLSRQRTWGVPIPAFFHKISGRPLISKSLVHHLCQLFESSGPDIWWTGQIETLFPAKICRELYVKVEDVVRGNDIMDIWFDSGISWSYVLNGKTSELYLEGADQYGGWFQTSLLTSVAIKNKAPFKKILTHGFAVDSKGRKMSKSLGNVIDPETVVQGKEALGVDTLRWWVACHSHHNIIPVSKDILKSNSEGPQKIRAVVRFLLGSLNNASQEDLEKSNGLLNLDRYVLNLCYDFYHKVMNSYDSYNVNKVCSLLLFFVANDISARYISVIKDRLYCDQSGTIRRKACQYTVNGILNTLCHAVAPILPHLAEEAFLHHPVYGGRKLFFSKNMWTPPEFWKDVSTQRNIALLDEIKKEVFAEKNFSKMSCLIEIDDDNFELLKNMQEGKTQSVDSELTEILQVAEVRLKTGVRKITLSPADFVRCLRCRRYTAVENHHLCSRCDAIVSTL